MGVGIMAHAVLTCSDKLNSGGNSLNELQKKTTTALCREWEAGAIDEWARSLPMAGATKKVCAAIADSLQDAGLQDGSSLLALRSHNDEQTEDLRKAFKLRKPPGPPRGKTFQVVIFLASPTVIVIILTHQHYCGLWRSQKALLAPSPPMRLLLERCFATRPSDRPASMEEVVRVLVNECGASASEASVVVTSDDTGRAGSLYNLGASLVEKAHNSARADTDQTADTDVLQRAVDAFGGAARLAAAGSVMRANA